MTSVSHKDIYMYSAVQDTTTLILQTYSAEEKGPGWVTSQHVACTKPLMLVPDTVLAPPQTPAQSSPVPYLDSMIDGHAPLVLPQRVFEMVLVSWKVLGIRPILEMICFSRTDLAWMTSSILPATGGLLSAYSRWAGGSI